MAQSLPAVEYTAPAVNPSGSGLYAAATPIEITGPSRHLGGVRIWPTNCGASAGTWSTDPCYVAPSGQLKYAERTAPGDPFEPVVVWTYDECDPTEGAATVEARARQNMRLQESVLVESHFAERLKSDSTAVEAAGIVDAVSRIEQALAELGFYGVIHASVRLAAFFIDKGMAIKSGALFKTPLGHTWAFGGGYDAVLGNEIVATGPVTIWRSDEVTRSALDHKVPGAGLIAAVSEKTVVVGYECMVGAVTVPASATGGSGGGTGAGGTLTEDPANSGLFTTTTS